MSIHVSKKRTMVMYLRKGLWQLKSFIWNATYILSYLEWRR